MNPHDKWINDCGYVFLVRVEEYGKDFIGYKRRGHYKTINNRYVFDTREEAAQSVYAAERESNGTEKETEA
jgi:hypothetical protein